MAALAVASHLSQALSVSPSPSFLSSATELQKYLQPKLDFLLTARPTAVNLGAATRCLSKVLDKGVQSDTDARDLAVALVKEARAVHEEDLGRNKEMGRHGADWLAREVEKEGEAASNLNLLTVCNTGSLATSVGLLNCII